MWVLGVWLIISESLKAGVAKKYYSRMQPTVCNLSFCLLKVFSVLSLPLFFSITALTIPDRLGEFLFVWDELCECHPGCDCLICYIARQLPSTISSAVAFRQHCSRVGKQWRPKNMAALRAATYILLHLVIVTTAEFEKKKESQVFKMTNQDQLISVCVIILYSFFLPMVDVPAPACRVQCWNVLPLSSPTVVWWRKPMC